MARLHILNNLFKLKISESSNTSDDNSSNSRFPLTGQLLREGYMMKKSRKSDEKVYGILTTEFFAYGSEEFHVTGPPTMQMRRILPLTSTLIT